MAWASLVWISMDVNVPATVMYCKWGWMLNGALPTEDLLVPVLLETINSQGKSGSIHDFNKSAGVLYNVWPLKSAFGNWKRWTLPNKADQEKILLTRPIQRNSAYLLYTDIKGRERAGRNWMCQWDILMVKRFPVSNVYTCKPRAVRACVCSQRQKLLFPLECYTLVLHVYKKWSKCYNIKNC